MAAALLPAVLAVLIVRALQVPQVRQGLGAVAALGAALVIAEGYGWAVLVLAAVLAAGILGPVAFLHQFVVPIPARARRAS